MSEHEIEAIALSLLVILASVSILGLLKDMAPKTYNEITGRATAGTTVNITRADPANCSFQLEDGMNLVSFSCIGDFQNATVMMENVSSLIAVFEYDKSSTDGWKVYSPQVPNWTKNDLAKLSKKRGYWVWVNQSQSFFHSGFLSGTTIELDSGYNLVGYPSREVKDINSSLSSINGSYTKVATYDTSSGSYRIYEPGEGGDLNETRPPEGYWINMSTSDSWVVD